MVLIEIGQEYGAVLLGVAAIATHFWMEGFGIFPVRQKLFTKEFYAKNFPGQFQGDKLPEAGYPDNGEGQFANKLPLRDWMTFQGNQRVKGNYLEGIASILTFLLISGLAYPRYTFFLSIVYLFGRIVFGIGYRMWGPHGRLPGAVIIDIALVLALGGAIGGAWSVIQGSSVMETAAVISNATGTGATPVTDAAAAAKNVTPLSDFHKLSALDINKQPRDFSEFEGKVVLVVNVASECGFTRQYAGLQKLQEKYGPRGFVVIGFPCNQFGTQEPGSNEEIKQFCSSKYGVTFPMMDKINVNGAEESPVYTFLKKKAAVNKISWNFEKFLINKKGTVQQHFMSKVEPEELEPKIEALLAQ